MPSSPTVSLRQRMEQHRAKASCAVCHNRLDPLGFRPGELRRRRRLARQGRRPSRSTPRGRSPRASRSAGPGELKAILKGRPREFARCLTEKMLTYALGRGLEESDRCAVDRIVKDLEARDYRFSALVLGIVTSDPFQKRRLLNPAWEPGGDRVMKRPGPVSRRTVLRGLGTAIALPWLEAMAPSAARAGEAAARRGGPAADGVPLRAQRRPHARLDARGDAARASAFPRRSSRSSRSRTTCSS